MAKAKWNVVDADAASALASRLEGLGEEIGQTCATMKAQAEEISNIDGTMEFNVQISRYLQEAADVLASTIDGVQDAGRQLSGIVASAQDFMGQATKGTLF